MAGDSPTTKLPPMAAGQRYGRLTSLEFVERDKNRNAIWRFRCDCGAELVARTGNVRNGSTQSCGCLLERVAGMHTLSHGMKGSPEYDIWCGMKQRCGYEKHEHFAEYGGRGIKICERWLHSFENFLADMGRRPSTKHTLDRKDNDLDYGPENCCWATRKDQSRNQRRTIMVMYGGREMPLAEAAELAGIRYLKVWIRIKRLGWSVERALSTPIKGPAADS